MDSESPATMTIIKDDGKKYVYDLLQFHFHADSEHLIGSKRADLEIHFVFI